MVKQKVPGSFPAHMDPAEARIVNNLITKMLGRGGEIRVRDYEEPDDVFVDWTRDRVAIQKETNATCGTVYDFRFEGDNRLGSVLLIHGNGEDVISDISGRNNTALDLMDQLFGSADE